MSCHQNSHTRTIALRSIPMALAQIQSVLACRLEFLRGIDKLAPFAPRLLGQEGENSPFAAPMNVLLDLSDEYLGLLHNIRHAISVNVAQSDSNIARSAGSAHAPSLDLVARMSLVSSYVYLVRLHRVVFHHVYVLLRTPDALESVSRISLPELTFGGSSVHGLPLLQLEVLGQVTTARLHAIANALGINCGADSADAHNLIDPGGLIFGDTASERVICAVLQDEVANGESEYARFLPLHTSLGKLSKALKKCSKTQKKITIQVPAISGGSVPLYT
ncbi:Hypothetical protein D9617_25g060870 [Elsinoe fawcettii]|nr:Hypothetical protein D9617_25g060870 [Elsinoe fawcettii]